MLYPISQFVQDSADLIVGFINAAGVVKVIPRFIGAGHFSEGKASVVEPSGHSGFLNLSGELAISASYLGVSHFHDGVCNVGVESGVGYIDHAGRWLIKPNFLIAMEFSEGRAFVSEDGETFALIDSVGSNVSKDRFERARPFRAGLAPVMKDGRWGFINNRAKTVIPFMFEDIRPQHFKSGLAAAKIAGRWGFIDLTGFFAINPVYEEVLPFSEGLASVKVEKKWGLIDLGGWMRLPPLWDEVGQFVNGLANAHLDGLGGYINHTGAWAIPPTFKKTKPFFGELAVVRIGEVPAYIRTDGKTVWHFEPQAIVPRPPVPF
jgi:hypothetical protein